MAASPRAKQLPHALSERLKRLAELPQNWNSYGAPPIKPEAIKKAESVLLEILAVSGVDEHSLPFVAPTADGCIGLEWKAPTGKELIMDIPADECPLSFLLVEPTESGEEEEIEGNVGDIFTLEELVMRLLQK